MAPRQTTGPRPGRAAVLVVAAVVLAVALTVTGGVGAPSTAGAGAGAGSHQPVADPTVGRARPAAAAAPVAGSVLEPYPTGDVAAPPAPSPPPASPGSSPIPVPDDGLPGAALDPDLVADALRPRLQGGALGGGRTPASVIDAATGQVLYAAADRPTTPASTTKLVTAASVLDAVESDAVLSTRAAVLDPDAAVRRIVLVGGGDPSLASTPGRVGGAGTSLRPASLRQLAGVTAQALGTDATVRVGYDASLFTGPALHPSWSKAFPAGGIVAPVSALQVDQGRRTPRGVARVADPAEAAAERFVSELERAGVTVTGRIRSTPLRADSVQLAAVSSPPVDVLVERMLATSDNDYAEALARLAAHATGHAASFSGVAERAREILDRLGPGAADDSLVDGSGLSRTDRLSPSTLTTLLRAHREGALAPGLPVAAATGSLRNRFGTAATDDAAGLARLKTGTLTGVAALSGFLSRPDGRLLAVAFLDGDAPGGTLAARTALDRAVATLVSCACTVRS